ncbi:MAG: adenylyl-sulfate reductase subunit alpha [Lachnospiraceae bacterium]|nr:adenylyl-sulfate reductase subunit alpha [Lachnospiraceae bacterium]
MEKKTVDSDVLIIGGGTAGCYAAICLGERSNLRICVVDKADIRRSGCLAAGVNALNAYITEGHTAMDYVRYASEDACSIAREDLLLDIAGRLNHVTRDLERRGLTILKDENGKYISRGWRNLKINGENLKPILASEVRKQKNVEVIEHVNITDLRTDGRARGAYGFGILDGMFYEFRAKAVLVASGGASGLYRPNNPENLAHQMWYSPFNTGAGYCMGILAGAEMTTFEMRFIALRCKDTIAPTGTIAQGVGVEQINAAGEVYESRYDRTTSGRLWGTVAENLEGRGPCYLKTSGIGKKAEEDLYRAYLNMAPMQTLKWVETKGPSSENVEIEGTEPYIVGGHTASGYWIGHDRQTTVPGLFAAGDVAGGCPQKYVTGALAEGEIAAEGMLEYIEKDWEGESDGNFLTEQSEEKKREYGRKLRQEKTGQDRAGYRLEQLETAMQKTMDEYAGGIRTSYRYSSTGLDLARQKISDLTELLEHAGAGDLYDLLSFYELRDRLIVARVLIAHLRAREETRWRGFQEYLDHPGKKKEFECYINSVLEDGKIRIIRRRLEHVPC